ncbi:salivary C-type lectin 2-like [Saccoglossus kowalevskii]|uniref:Tetranectin-like protein-like isoform 1 n=1 Tax=Saccoglossus kowalevskii TaxID=10224 RepID=A0ABM0GJ76_SACKO|nr:PREDICTED: tetranectin-like protein-like isoform 1 [Saccoglossus kowalevskii]XP_002731029.1 PREDICTED: tetranectin-like protein-like isoform 2 [Saccoglossus kowalevskii]
MKLQCVIIVVLFVSSTYGVDLIQLSGENDVCDPVSGIRYKFFYESKSTWTVAVDDCFADGGQLATVNYLGLHKRIRRYINSQPNIVNPLGDGYWINGNDRMAEGYHVLLDGAPLTYTEGWHSEEVGGVNITQPNNNVARDCHGQDCLQLWQRPKNVPGKLPSWNLDDEYCFELKSYLCEYPGTAC